MIFKILTWQEFEDFLSEYYVDTAYFDRFRGFPGYMIIKAPMDLNRHDIERHVSGVMRSFDQPCMYISDIIVRGTGNVRVYGIAQLTDEEQMIIRMAM